MSNIVADLVKALEDAKRALCSDPPHGPQKSLMPNDTAIYHLDAQTCSSALCSIREALARAKLLDLDKAERLFGLYKDEQPWLATLVRDPRRDGEQEFLLLPLRPTVETPMAEKRRSHYEN
jgi:hypothetical protein